MRLIDADKIGFTDFELFMMTQEREDKWKYAYQALSEKISRAPIIDAVPVVRCKDCVHLEILNGSTYYARCGWHGRLFESFGRADTRTWFCADGERRTE